MIRAYCRTLRNYLRTPKAQHDLKDYARGNVTLHTVGLSRNVSTVDKLRAYCRTLRNYLRTPKAQHDLKDYARALMIIFSVTAIIIFVLQR